MPGATKGMHGKSRIAGFLQIKRRFLPVLNIARQADESDNAGPVDAAGGCMLRANRMAVYDSDNVFTNMEEDSGLPDVRCS